MPKIKRNHENSRSVVCLICRYKIFKKERILNNGTKLIDLIKLKYSFLSNYDPADMTVPNALCTNCCIELYNSDNSQQNSAPPLIKACAYIEHNGRPEAMHTRACSASTTCDICLTARQIYKKPHTPCICHTCTHFNNLKITSKLALEKTAKKKQNLQQIIF